MNAIRTTARPAVKVEATPAVCTGCGSKNKPIVVWRAGEGNFCQDCSVGRRKR